jgi:O-antigen ligase/tetratricopeptide (TPR) repeat protein
MRGTTVYFDLADTADPAFDRPVEWLLVGLLAFLPLAFGGVFASSEAIFLIGALAMGLMLAVKLLRRPDVPFVRSWTYWPIAVFIALVVLQLLPLPQALVRVISPATVNLRHQYLDELPGAAERLRWMTLSLYPENTLHDLRLIVALAIVFVVTLNCIRRVSQIRRILGAVAIIGAACAALALVQDISGSDAVYFLFRNPSGRVARGGPFVNKNHFGQFMNLAIGAAIGLALVLINQQFRRDNYTRHEVKAKLKLPELRPAWMLLAMIVLSAAALVFSLSRGAMLGAALAGLIVGIFVSTRSNMPGKGWTLLAVLMCIAAVVLLDTGRIVERISAQSSDTWHGHRLEILRDLSVSWRKFPLFGTGLGTHPVIFPRLDRSDVPLLASHAENEYAQLLTETGAAGILIFLGFLAIVIGALLRATRGSLSPASAAAIGLGYGLIATLVQSATDFAQHMPAIALLTAVSCALILNLAELRWRERGQVSTELPRRGSLLMRAGALAGVFVIGAWLSTEALSAWRADSAWQVGERIRRDLEKRQWIAENPEYVDILDAAQTASSIRPRNIEYHYWLNFYRYKSISRLSDEESGEVLMSPEQHEYAARIVDELHAGRWLCPTHGPTYLLAGQMERFILDRPQVGAQHIFTGYALSGADPTAAFLAGQVAATDGDEQASVNYLRRAAKLNPQLLPEITRLYVRQLKRPDLALEAAGNDVATLTSLADLLGAQSDEASQALAERARQRAFESLLEQSNSPDAPGAVLAAVAAEYDRRGNPEQAVIFYRRALTREISQTEWRMNLARALQKLGRNQEAQHEVQLVLRWRPRLPEATKLLDELNAKKTDKTDTRN